MKTFADFNGHVVAWEAIESVSAVFRTGYRSAFNVRTKSGLEIHSGPLGRIRAIQMRSDLIEAWTESRLPRKKRRRRASSKSVSC